MTTIAYKDGVIAYDSRVTRGSLILSDTAEKMHVVNGVHFFGTGAVIDIKKLIAGYPDGNGCSGDIDSRVIAVTPEGLVAIIGCTEEDGYWVDLQDSSVVNSIGSGSDFAFAAMDMGATAKEAVQIAAGRDIYTGGAIREFKIQAVI